MGDVLEYSKARPRWTIKRIVLWTVTPVVLVLLAMYACSYVGVWRAGMAGRAEADSQWAAGRATIYTYGYRTLGHDIETSTGLRLEPIAGCFVDDEITSRANWHNDRILDLIAKKGLPAYSWLNLEPGICKPKATWLSRVSRGETPIAITDTVALVTAGTARHSYRLRIDAGTGDLEIDGKVVPARYEPVTDLYALGGVQDEKVLYLRGAMLYRPEHAIYIAMELGGAWVQFEIVTTP